jgi:hypothetical protein
MDANKILIRAVIELRVNLDAVGGQLANLFLKNGLFAGDLTECGDYVLLPLLQPKSGLFQGPDAGDPNSSSD